MSNTLSFDDARSKARQQFGDFVVSTADGTDVSLRSPVRMPKEERRKLQELQNELPNLNEAGQIDEAVSRIYDMFRVAAEDSAAVEKMIADLENEDLATTMVILEEYGKVSQAGEA